MAKRKKNFWQVLSLSGAIGIVFYTLHVVVGGILWKEYNPVAQTISELTAGGAPNAALLKIFTSIYGILMIVFSFALYFIFKSKKLNKNALIGSGLLIVMEITSLFGYTLFPLNTTGALFSFQNIMHIIVTVVVVLSSIGLIFFIGIGLRKSSNYNGIGMFVFICAFIFTISGMCSPIVMAKGIPVAGLVERVNIFTLQICLFIVSVYFFAEIKGNVDAD